MGRASFTNMTGTNDVHRVGELVAAGNVLIDARECGHDLGDWLSIHERAHRQL